MLLDKGVIQLAKEIKQLRQRDYMLECLESGGVDNWDWYSESLKPYYKRYYPEDFEGNEDD